MADRELSLRGLSRCKPPNERHRDDDRWSLIGRLPLFSGASPFSPAPDQFAPMPLEEVDSALESFGLSSYRDRSEVSQRNSGKIELKVADGKITVEIQRPVRVAIRASNLMTDLPEILQSLKQKGFEA